MLEEMEKNVIEKVEDDHSSNKLIAVVCVIRAVSVFLMMVPFSPVHYDTSILR